MRQPFFSLDIFDARAGVASLGLLSFRDAFDDPLTMRLPQFGQAAAV
jgi:hypothetical protein